MGDSFAVIVAVDGLRADALASYGNAEADTPFLNRLSAESTLFDFAFCLDASLEGFYLSAVRGTHPCYEHLGGDAGVPADQLPLRSDETCHYFLSDSPAATRIDAAPFTWTRMPAGPSLFPTAVDWLNERFRACNGRKQVAWLHASLVSAEDVVESRQHYDTLVTAMDAGLRRLFTELSVPGEGGDILFIVVGCRGYALGEHGYVGSERPLLHEELLHVPLIVYSRHARHLSHRVDRLVSPFDLGTLLRNWLDGEKLEEGKLDGPANGSPIDAAISLRSEGTPADCLYFANSEGDQAIRTPGWYLLRRPPADQEPTSWESGPPPASLFLKPDDRWELNEISALRPEIAEGLSARLDTLASQASSGAPLRLSPLPPEFLTGW